MTFPFLLILVATLVESTSVEEDLSLTKKQSQTLGVFRKMMLPLLDKTYKKEDVYLIRWLKHRNFNLDRAKGYLTNDIEWRKTEKMDEILNEDWSEIEKDIPFKHLGNDVDGKPILYFHFGEMDVRKLVLQGKTNLVLRRFNQMMEWGESLVRMEQDKGKNVTRYHIIPNLKGFNARQHLCPACVTIYVQIVINFESHFPLTLDTYSALNGPQIFQTVINAVLPFMSEENRNVIKFYAGKQEWEPALRKFLPSEAMQTILED